ncbi:tRNA lysidine(34) synthetase TilS [Winogradskyella sp. 3972H.M.0a.05]|uniref:tRNA lysidine(34) synthetase TilS n=1 Tax=Winogradskyella sp. 3972H.M.0a.05 TaxID=2950277 RepID=UPI00339616F5
MQDIFKTIIDNELSFLKEKKLLIAISGGVDSVVLTYLSHEVGLNVALAHCNFKLREEESDLDEAFVEELAKTLQLEIFTQSFDTKAYAKKNKLSIQMAARELRYNWFQDLAEQLDYDYILTAHHADDNLETFLINFLRGTGLNGLTGIPKIQGKYVRPLLEFSRKEIEQYAKANAIQWREDSSNSSRKYLRNKLRHDLVPILKEINPELLETFKKTLSNLKDISSITEDRLNAFKDTAVAYSNENETAYHISEFKNVNNPQAYLFEIFKKYGFSEWNDVLHLLEAQSGKQVVSETHRLIKHREFLLLAERESDNNFSVLVNAESVKIDTPSGILFFDEADAVKDHSETLVYVDKSKLQYPLEIRHWREGNWFYPFGMTGKKKLSKYFKDEKLSLLDKEKQLVLCSGDDIVWVIGRRLDNRYGVTTNTSVILKIELQK